MKRSHFVKYILIFVFGWVLIAPIEANACKMHKGHDDYNSGDIEGKFFHKVYFILSESGQLQLSEDQMIKIQKIKMDAKKELIMKQAETKIASIDIMMKLGDDPVDVDLINRLVDKKFEFKKAESNAVVKAFAKLIETLTPEQKTKLKDLAEEN